jgi:hypothetical protein
VKARPRVSQRTEAFEERCDPRGDLHAQVGRPASDCAETETMPTIRAERTKDFMVAGLFRVCNSRRVGGALNDGLQRYMKKQRARMKKGGACQRGVAPKS